MDLIPFIPFIRVICLNLCWRKIMNIKIREAVVADAASIATININTWKIAYKGIIPQAYLDSLSIDEKIPRWKKTIAHLKENCKQIFVAEVFNLNKNKIVGFSVGGPSHFEKTRIDGELYAIYILPAYWRQKIGTRLFYSMIDYFLNRNYKDMIIWSLKDNPACKFYKKMGGSPKFNKTLTYGGKELDTLGFYWGSLPDHSIIFKNEKL